MILPYVGPISFDNVSGDIPRGFYDYSTFVIPGVDGTGTLLEGQRFPDQTFICTAFCTDQIAVNMLKNMLEAIQMNVVEIQNSLGEVWSNCLILNVEIPPDATIGCIARNVPNGDGTVRIVCNRKIDVKITVRFQF